MRFGSVCSGIETASEAWHPLGWQAAFYSEIEPFPCHVLHHHHSSGRPAFMPDPDEPGLKPKDRASRIAAIKVVKALPERANGVPNHGDMTQFEEWPDHAIDLLVGGTPCQSYSVAGLRKGLADPRGDLMLTYAAIARRYRPRWLVWENVFGVLSSGKGRDFASLLGLLSGRRVEVPADGWKSAGIVEGYEGAYGLAWRVFDTQYVRVDGAPRALPQRRRRVFVVGHSGGDWRRAAAVLFEREGLSGNPAPRRETGQRVAATISARPTGGGGLGTDFDLDGGQTAISEVAGCMVHQAHGGVDTQTALNGYQIPVAEAFGGNNCSGPIDVAASLAAHSGPAGRLDFASETFVAHSLRPAGFDSSEDGTGRGTPLVPVYAMQERMTSLNPDNGPNGKGRSDQGTAFTLESRQTPQPVAFSIMPQNSGKDYKARQVEVAQLVMAGGPVGGNQGGDYIVDPVAFSSKDHGADASVGVSPTLRAMGHGESHPNAGGQVAIAFNHQAGGDQTSLGFNPSAGVTGTLESNQTPAIVQQVRPINTQVALRHEALGEDTGFGVGDCEDPAYTLSSRHSHAVQHGWAVRRLTPTECARLQGFKDDHCRIPWRGKPAEQCPDGPQYKAYGNAMSTNVMSWIGERIEGVDQIERRAAA